ncbi:MAG TPA: hydroxyacid dehydrogenase [Bacteroidaceae bacterium]|nr:hydroxyacid dehydrogenase [Bacteroidaceae bacterium]
MKYNRYPDILKRYPSTGSPDRREEISSELHKKRVKLVIIDDDPTGIQTVHGCPLLTKWERPLIEEILKGKSDFFYILSNSRSLDRDSAVKINREIIRAVVEANKELSYKLIFISRSDSTLRGHFPHETNAITEELKHNGIDIELPVCFVPAFIEAGRITVENIHYMRNGEELIPVARSEFAKDYVFGYHHSDLKEYIVEKSDEKVHRRDIGSLSLDALRSLSDSELQDKLKTLSSFRYIIINALEYIDLYRFSLALVSLLQTGDSSVVIRSSSSLPKSLSGISDRDLLSREDLGTEKKNGLFFIGSHVQKTTWQLNDLLRNEGTVGIEAEVLKILKEERTYLREITERITEIYSVGKTPVVYTSRKEYRPGSKNKSLDVSRKISAFISSLVLELPVYPDYIVAKGGITSHDILIKGLGVTATTVWGQILPGVPVLLIKNDKTGYSLPYIIFPGNVGGDQSLSEIYRKLQ